MRNPDAAVATEDSRNPRNRIPSRILLAAYLAHLAIPLAVALDSFRTIHEGMAANPTRGMGFVCVAWIAAALGALLLSRDRDHFLNRMSKPLLIFFGLCLALAIGEVAVRAEIRYFNRAVLRYPPGSSSSTSPARTLLGCHPRSHLLSTRWGSAARCHLRLASSTESLRLGEVPRSASLRMTPRNGHIF